MSSEKHVGTKYRSMAAAVIALSIIVSAISPAVAGALHGGGDWFGDSPAGGKIDQLIEAIKRHVVACSEVTDKQTDLSNRCSKEKTDLLSQQAKLEVSDSLINERLNANLPASTPRWP
jgi:hypothetical protein